jgi:hypothetical protein
VEDALLSSSAAGKKRRGHTHPNRTSNQSQPRIAGASVSALLAAAWLVERTLGLPNPTAGLVAWLESPAVAADGACV